MSSSQTCNSPSQCVKHLNRTCTLLKPSRILILLLLLLLWLWLWLLLLLWSWFAASYCDGSVY